MKRRNVLKLLATALTVCHLGMAHADDNFPERPVTIVVPFAAGGTTDVIARALQAPLTKLLGQPVIVENRAGASGIIGANYVSTAQPDGYTILMPNNGFLIPPITSETSGYDAEDSFEPISLLTKQPLMLLVNPEVKAKNLADFIAYAKDNEATFASSGPQSITETFTEQLAQMAGIKVLHIPYRGQGPSLQAVLAKEVDALLNVSSTQMYSLVEAERVRLLGVATSNPETLPEGVPAISSVVPGFTGEVWFGFFAPKGTPQAKIDKLSAAVNSALEMPEIIKIIRQIGAEPIGGTSEELRQLVRNESADLKKTLANFKKSPEQ